MSVMKTMKEAGHLENVLAQLKIHTFVQGWRLVSQNVTLSKVYGPDNL